MNPNIYKHFFYNSTNFIWSRPWASLHLPFQAAVRCVRRALLASQCALLPCLGRQSLSVILNTPLLLIPHRHPPTILHSTPPHHPLVFLLGFAEQLQDVDGPRLCDTIGPLWFRSLRRSPLGVFCFLLHDPQGQFERDCCLTHTDELVLYIAFRGFNWKTLVLNEREDKTGLLINLSGLLTWPLAVQSVDSRSCRRTKYCRFPLWKQHEDCNAAQNTTVGQKWLWFQANSIKICEKQTSSRGGAHESIIKKLLKTKIFIVSRIFLPNNS